jgi:hypothetical protein
MNQDLISRPRFKKDEKQDKDKKQNKVKKEEDI